MGHRWQDMAWRMAADFAMSALSIIIAFVSWFVVKAVVLRSSNLDELRTVFYHFALGYWLLWALLAVLIFICYGFYSRTRLYTRQYKALAILQAVTVLLLVFVFTDYFVLRSTLIPRGVAALGWLFTMLSVGGSRLAKNMFLANFHVETRKPELARVERVLVVGGAGYIGSHIVSMLLNRGYHVRVLDTFMFGRESLASVAGHENCELIEGDVRDIEAVVRSVRNCQAIIHLAAIVGDPACEENRPLAVEVNRAATRMLVDIAKGYGVTRFVFASTCSVYGASDLTVDEHTAPAPLSTYARTKIDSEELLLAAKTDTFHPTILRLGTLFGISARPRFDLVVNLLTARAATTGKITIYNGEQWRPFLHVADAARAFIMVMEADPVIASGEIFNVGDARYNLRLSDLSAQIASLLPHVEVQHIDNSDKRNYRASFDKISRVMGFACTKSVEEGIREIRDAVLNREISDINSHQFNNLAAVRAFTASGRDAQSAMRTLSTLAEPDEMLIEHSAKPATAS
jgi:nucleoside-diphosphate-sugar epimerase